MTTNITPRNALVACRLTPGEHEQLRRLAADRGLSVSDLIRQALQESAGFRPIR